MVGFAREEVLGRNGMELGLDVDSNYQNKVLELMRRDGHCRNVEIQVERRTGEKIWVQLLGAVFELDGAQWMLSIGRDISDTKAAEARLAAAQDDLREAQEHYRVAFETSLDCVNINRVDDGAYVEINPAFTRIMGYERQEVIGNSSLHLHIWADPHDREKLMDELRRNSECRNLEAQFRAKNGNLTWGLMSASIIELKGVPCILSVTRDISEAKAAQQRLAAATEALRASESHYRTIFQTSLDGICISRLSDGQYIDVNRAFLDIFGFDDEELVGRTSLDITTWVDPSLRSRLAELLKQDGTFRDIETQYRKKNGDLFWVTISLLFADSD